jgi:glucan phosphoethanolaminetransferase (alkaline phosphatase superfamily)
MPKGYLAMWIAISLAYLIWMVFFMKDIVLVNYATVAERTVDGVLHANISGMLGHEWLYPVWVVLSTVCLLMFIFYIKDILYAPQLTKAIKAFCLIGIIFGCVYVTWYGFFGDQPFIEKVKTITASMIGLDFPWHFRGWGVFASMTIFTNTMFAYRRYNYNSKLGVILGSIGSAAIFVTINCPSMGEEMHLDSPRCMAHWAGALIFAFCCAAPMVILLFSKARKEKGAFLAAFIIFCAILATMLVLLITVGKSAIIENIPMQAAYILLFLLNFTNIFEKKAAAKEAIAA